MMAFLLTSVLGLAWGWFLGEIGLTPQDKVLWEMLIVGGLGITIFVDLVCRL